MEAQGTSPPRTDYIPTRGRHHQGLPPRSVLRPERDGGSPSWAWVLPKGGAAVSSSDQGGTAVGQVGITSHPQAWEEPFTLRGTAGSERPPASSVKLHGWEGQALPPHLPRQAICKEAILNCHTGCPRALGLPGGLRRRYVFEAASPPYLDRQESLGLPYPPVTSPPTCCWWRGFPRSQKLGAGRAHLPWGH